MASDTTINVDKRAFAMDALLLLVSIHIYSVYNLLLAAYQYDLIQSKSISYQCVYAHASAIVAIVATFYYALHVFPAICLQPHIVKQGMPISAVMFYCLFSLSYPVPLPELYEGVVILLDFASLPPRLQRYFMMEDVIL